MSNDERVLKPLVKTTTENRKLPKPLIEKKRRARINKSLTELKILIGDVLKREMQNSKRKRKSGKVEKADILELTVKYLRDVKHLNHNLKTMVNSGYQKGYVACLEQVKHFLRSNSRQNNEIAISSLINRLHDSFAPVKSSSSSPSLQPLPPPSLSSSYASSIASSPSPSPPAFPPSPHSPNSNSITCSVIKHTNGVHPSEDVVMDGNLWRPW